MIEIDDKKFKESLNIIAASDDGKVVLSYLKDAMGWDDIFMTLEDNNQANVYYQTRRAVYGWLRGMISKDELKKIEFNYKRKAVENDGSGSTRNNINTRKRTTRSANK